MDLKNFTLKKNVFVKEINSYFIEFAHVSGTKIVHIKNEDIENLFSISLRTLPFDSSGIFHILEHMVLFGSKKFPTKDPFFEMRKRSLATFMNAMTGEDFTCYPASSLIEKDFYNLLEVYIDAVFNPLLNMESFLQEGWRIEKKEIKGVVFNEMKGALNSQDERLYLSMFKNLMPNLPYKYNSGGEPKEILKLTQKDLLEAHKKFYSLSNSIFFFYGNIKTEKHLKFLEKNILKNFTKKTKIPPIFKNQKRFKKEKEVLDFFPSSKKEDAIISFGWLTCNISKIEDVLALKILESILLENDASPLKYALLQSKLCNYIESFIDTSIKEIPWMITLKGTNKKNKNKIFALIIKTLKNIKFNKKEILSAMHCLEFETIEINSSSMPYGLLLFMKTILLKQHNIKNPEDALKIQFFFKKLQKKIFFENPKYLNQMLEKYILRNKHLVKLTMVPDPKLQEKENLEILKRKKIILKEKKFPIPKKATFANPNILPKIEIKDIPKTSLNYTLHKEKNIFSHKCFTNNIIYADLVFNIPNLSQEELFYFSFLASNLTELDCKNRNYQENLQYIHQYIGSVSAYINFNTQIDNPLLCFPKISIKGKAFYKNQKKLISLLKDLATCVKFTDKNRIKELILQNFTIFSNSIYENALFFANLESTQSFSSSCFLNNQLNGLPFFKHLQELLKDIDKNLPIFIEKLKNIYQKVFSSKPNLIITASEKFLKKQNFDYIFKNFKPKNFKPWNNSLKIISPKENIGKIIPSPVFFTSFGTKTIAFSHRNAPHLYLASKIFENKILHPKIREQGGAYGSGAVYKENGTFYFYSYRDPNLSKTINTFLESIKKIKNGNFSQKEIDEAKLQIIQKMDSPISVGNRGIFTFYQQKRKKTLKFKKLFRKILLSATKENIIQGASLLPTSISNYKISTFAGEKILKTENKTLKKSLTIQSI